jgi:uncharacterized protein YijF (DUF1287 family)
MMLSERPTNRRPIFWALILASTCAGQSPPAEHSDIGDFTRTLVNAAIERTEHRVIYDGSYRTISYPGGDVPDSIGVCTDLIVRAYRAVGIDLQKEVHEDMTTAFDSYPDNWGLTKPDPNIDHRRVLNLRTFFRRRGVELPVTEDPEDYRPGELVTWMLPGNLPHVGLVTNERSRDGERPMIVHNIGSGPEIEDMLFRFEITGHYSYGDTLPGESPSE